MKPFVQLSLAFAALVSAAPDAVTPLAYLQPRNAMDPAALGWVSTRGASVFSDLRSCDFPATLTSSRSIAQCCAVNVPCNFFTTCSAGTVFAESASVVCDNGHCNTGVIVPTPGASEGQSMLACWPTSLGQEQFTLVADTGSAPIATPTGGASSRASSDASRSQTESAGPLRTAASSNGAASSTVAGTEASASPTGAAATSGFQVLTGALGVMAGLLAYL